MIRPEQIEFRQSAPPGTVESGANAKVISSTFYGPDTVVELGLNEVSEPIRARVLRGHDLPVPGSSVEVVVVGPVMGYPAGTASPAPMSGDKCVGGRT
jgi:hypothetical protein